MTRSGVVAAVLVTFAGVARADTVVDVNVGATVTTTSDPVTTTQETTEETHEEPTVQRGTEKGTIGLGLMLGEPTGITARLYLADDQAIQAGVGFAFFGNGFQVTADYVVHPYILQIKPEYVIATYVGPGLRAIDYSKNGDQFLGLGLRGVAGLLFDFQIPIDAFVEVAGVVEYKFHKDEGLGVALNASVGARYYF